MQDISKWCAFSSNCSKNGLHFKPVFKDHLLLRTLCATPKVVINESFYCTCRWGTCKQCNDEMALRLHVLYRRSGEFRCRLIFIATLSDNNKNHQNQLHQYLYQQIIKTTNYCHLSNVRIAWLACSYEDALSLLRYNTCTWSLSMASQIQEGNSLVESLPEFTNCI